MTILDELQQGVPKTTLYHYTNQNGLFGIIKKKKMWGSDILFLNDSTEWEYALNRTRGAILTQKELLEPLDYVNEKDFLDLLNHILNDLFKLTQQGQIFVCSFSEKGDLLSQWRGYCPNGNGFSLGFNPDVLAKFNKKKNFRFSNCIYDKNEQLRIINEAIEEALKNLRAFYHKNPPDTADKEKRKDDKVTKIWEKFIINFIEFAPFFKHPSFSEEREWRLIERPKILFGDEQTKFREGKSFLIPYREISLTDDDDKFPLQKICIGPTHHYELSKISVTRLLKANGIENCEINISEIPYRE